jgi:hypothetical protein
MEMPQRWKASIALHFCITISWKPAAGSHGTRFVSWAFRAAELRTQGPAAAGPRPCGGNHCQRAFIQRHAEAPPAISFGPIFLDHRAFAQGGVAHKRRGGALSANPVKRRLIELRLEAFLRDTLEDLFLRRGAGEQDGGGVKFPAIRKAKKSSGDRPSI